MSKGVNYEPIPIQVLNTSQAIRKRPNMYLAWNDDDGKLVADPLKNPHVFTRLIIEAMCLSRAFASIGQVTQIEVIVKGNNVLVYNNGPGISMENESDGTTLIEKLMTQLHACKNIKHENIKDFCDAGIVVVNCVSEFLEVFNVVDNVAYVFNYTKGEPDGSPRMLGTAKRNGLAIEFLFDSEIFGDLKIDHNDLLAEIEKIKPSTPAKIITVFDN